jgi:hypothetical protein
MSLWELMRCENSQCRHARHLHRKGSGNVGLSLKGGCKDSKCSCERFKEPERSESAK